MISVLSLCPGQFLRLPGAALSLGPCLHSLSDPFLFLFSLLTLITPGADQWQPLVIDLGGHSSVAAPGQY